MAKIFLLFSSLFYFLNLNYGQEGKFDTTFGINGIIRNNIGPVKDLNTTGGDVFVQTDQSIFIITKTDNETRVAKRRPGGL